MRVAIVAEYYPRPSHPGLGVWAHRQAMAVRDLGVDVRVLVLERPIPPLAAVARAPRTGRCASGRARPRPAGPADDGRDRGPLRAVHRASPAVELRQLGRWAAPPLRQALDRLSSTWQPDLSTPITRCPRVSRPGVARARGSARCRWSSRCTAAT